SVAIDAAGEIAAITSSKGGVIVFVDIAQSRVIGARKVSDVSGVAPSETQNGFLVTNGEGEVRRAHPARGLRIARYQAIQWDNHAVRVR
ncbi:MAG: DUF1513 domain-containing protein, partial [Pseudomonadota bacterium]